MEDALDLAIELEKVILAQVHFPVLNLHGFLDGLLQVDDYLVSSLRLNVLIDVAIGADGVQLHHINSLRTIKKLNFDEYIKLLQQKRGTYLFSSESAKETEKAAENGHAEILGLPVRHRELNCRHELLSFTRRWLFQE